MQISFNVYLLYKKIIEKNDRTILISEKLLSGIIVGGEYGSGKNYLKENIEEKKSVQGKYFRENLYLNRKLVYDRNVNFG